MISQWTSDALRSAGSILLCYATIAAISTEFQLEHFTWWSLATTAVWSFFNGFYPVTGATYFFLFFSIQLAVVAGVIIMGLGDCKVFYDAHKLHGSTNYIFGNYVRNIFVCFSAKRLLTPTQAMHYLPSVAGVLLVDKKSVTSLHPLFICFVSTIAVGVYFSWSFFVGTLKWVLSGLSKINTWYSAGTTTGNVWVRQN